MDQPAQNLVTSYPGCRQAGNQGHLDVGAVWWPQDTCREITGMLRTSRTRERPPHSGVERPAFDAANTYNHSSGNLTSSPVTDQPMIIRWISDVPSKIVKILDYGTISAGQRPVRGRGISTDPARAVRGWRRFGRGPRRHRSPTLPPVHLRYISALTCQYSFCRRDVALRSTIREGPLGRATHGPDVPTRFPPRTGRRRADTAALRGGQAMTRPARPIPPSWCCRCGQHMGGCQSHFRNSARAVAEHANPGRIEIVQAKWHLLGQLGDGLPHRCRRLAGVRCRGKRRQAAGPGSPGGTSRRGSVSRLWP
jgi:hypothetical protein